MADKYDLIWLKSQDARTKALCLREILSVGGMGEIKKYESMLLHSMILHMEDRDENEFPDDFLPPDCSEEEKAFLAGYAAGRNVELAAACLGLVGRNKFE